LRMRGKTIQHPELRTQHFGERLEAGED